MQFYFAPMEGITGSLYRRIHCRHFPGIDRYFIPFLEPRDGMIFDAHDRRQIDPAENAGIPAVPQMLTNRADRFAAGVRYLADLGYSEVNLNLGCPARTVVSRGRGAGFLARREELERFLDEIFANSPLPISIKTRLGVEDEGEFEALLALYRRYPLTELIVHARVLADQYKYPVRQAAFARAFEDAPWPVCYNGDLFSRSAVTRFQADFPQTERVMLGRGLIANPGLVRECQTGVPLTAEELRSFHDDLLSAYQAQLSGERNVLCWMKELWSYWGCLYPDSKREQKAVRKAQTLSAYWDAAETLLSRTPVTETGYSK
ncbi:MAG: tRNA-dihydrouridine synthase family protein [Oscillospiraceae bacterium]|nr:tRNA-dihydrouridine synthase family protein [Oscillospiraceae bacterium]